LPVEKDVDLAFPWFAAAVAAQEALVSKHDVESERLGHHLVHMVVGSGGYAHGGTRRWRGGRMYF
jgi:hypothetical protein